MTSVRILQLFPEVADINGDAENALVLARRLQWTGVNADIVPLGIGQPAPTVAPTIIVLGSGVDSALPRTRDALEVIRGPLTDWLGAGVPLLAVGTGLELLGRRVDLEQETLVGLGIVPGETTRLGKRVAGELVLDSIWGRLYGYENHGRGFTLDAGVTPFGRVVAGIGNGDDTDGVHLGNLYGTHLHGPALARNPALAMSILAAAVGDDAYVAGRADGVAEAINAAAARRLGL